MANDTNQRRYAAKSGAQALAKPKKSSEPFVMLPAEVIKSDAYAALGYSARAILIELVSFYYGKNNGQLWIAPEMLKERGFSKNTAIRSYKELLIHGFIFQTKKGGSVKGGCSWYALTWLPLNKSEGMNLTCYEHKKFTKFAGKEKICCPKMGTAKTQNGYHAKSQSLNGNAKESMEKPFPISCDTQNGALNRYMPSIGMNKHDLLDALNGDTLDNWVQKNGVRLRKIGHINPLQTIH
jgi:hypothetical protein